MMPPLRRSHLQLALMNGLISAVAFLSRAPHKYLRGEDKEDEKVYANRPFADPDAAARKLIEIAMLFSKFATRPVHAIRRV
jgi:hypothetical protein